MFSAKGALPECLTDEEKLMLKDASNFLREYQNFIIDIVQRQVLGCEFGKKKKGIVLRFLKDAPSIVGSNLKTYGPFKAEDVASLPVENAEILIQRGLAKKISL
jgi:DNA replication factor GINS